MNKKILMILFFLSLSSSWQVYSADIIKPAKSFFSLLVNRFAYYLGLMVIDHENLGKGQDNANQKN